jgi:hypothetical protein
MENFEKTWKPTSKELEVKKLGTEQEKKKIKDWYPYYTEERDGLISLLHEYVDVFA